ncbi:MAG TPA: SHOCT domain-containing protein [Ilumatobacteraceae bacterium]|nr:SHOCT domain-containing protein [Ilumatobacteraceae bacterium]
MMRRGIGRAGRPGVMGTMARTAVVAGTASAVAGGVAHHQQGKQQQAAEAQQYEMAEAQAAQQAQIDQAVAAQVANQQAAAPAPDMIEQLKELASLRDAGVLTDAEFAVQKAKLLG